MDLWGGMLRDEERNRLWSPYLHLVDESLGFCREGEGMWFSACQEVLVDS
jgi:hypothetical protein